MNRHAPIAENHSGSIRFTDPQAGDDDVFGYFLVLRMVALSVGGLMTLSFPFKLKGVFNGQSLFLCVSKVLGLFEGEYRGLRSNLALR